jgi:hypothetical protein
VSSEVVLGEDPVTIGMDVRINGKVTEPRPATVVGMQNNVLIYTETRMVSTPRGGPNKNEGGLSARWAGEIRVDFPPYTPTNTGDILWLATIDDDDPDVDEETKITKVEEDDDPPPPPPPPPPPGDGEDNLISLHDRRSDQFAEKECLECHGDVLTRQSQDPTIQTAHINMLPFAAGKNDKEKCVFCHRSVDLSEGTQRQERSTGNIGRYVDVAVCTLCHAPGREGGSQLHLYQETLFSPSDPDGPYLYEVLCSGCHRVLEDSKVAHKKAEEIQEKIDKDEGGMGPLQVLTWDEVVAIADALAEVSGDAPGVAQVSRSRARQVDR